MTTTSLSGPSSRAQSNIAARDSDAADLLPALKLTPRNERPLLAAEPRTCRASYCQTEKLERRTTHLIDIGEHGAKPGNVSRCSRSARECKRNVSDVAAHRGENAHWAEELEVDAIRWVYGKKFGGVKRSLQESCASES